MMFPKPMITPFEGYTPVMAPNVFVDPSVRLIGRVTLKSAVSIWPGAVLRADDEEIVIEENSAVLDLCLLEAPRGKPVYVASDSLISHKACVHGARIQRGALVGIGAIVLDGAIVGEGSLIGAGALIPPGMKVPPGKLMLGQPARPIRDLKPEERANVAAQLTELKEKAILHQKVLAQL
jgi:carbonic anhydrase/acetyltransferase-like protein (isoleucine patch superfamily)